MYYAYAYRCYRGSVVDCTRPIRELEKAERWGTRKNAEELRERASEVDESEKKARTLLREDVLSLLNY